MFHKYPSICNEKQIKKIKKVNLIENKEWIRQEKIHGANFSIIPFRDESENGVSVNYASRTGIIMDGDNTFFDFSNIMETCKQSAIKLFKNFPKASQINIYGELYGGKIQPEIKYQPEHLLRIFDVLIDNTTWLSYDKFNIITDSGFEIVTILEKGSLMDLMNRNTSFISEYSTKDNQEHAEGYVVKYIDNNGEMIAAKHRAPQFMEDKRGKIITQQPIIFNIEPIHEIGVFENYLLNKNRISSMLSKIGPVNENIKIATFTCELIDDAAKEYADDTNESYKSVRRMMFIHFNVVSDFVKQEFKTRI